MPYDPWVRVFGLLETPADGVALMAMLEYREDLLLANGVSPAEFLGVGERWISERGFAAAIADALNERNAARSLREFSYTDFYSPSRRIDPTEGEVSAFCTKCKRVGIKFTYREMPGEQPLEK